MHVPGTIYSNWMKTRIIWILAETASIGIHVLLVVFHRYHPKKYQYEKKKYIEFLKRVFENNILFEFPDLEELSKSAFNRNSSQIDLISSVIFSDVFMNSLCERNAPY